MTPDPLNRLVAQLSKLPGIGEKTAQRLAFRRARDVLPTKIETQRLILRAPIRGDVPALTQLADNKNIADKLSRLPSPYTRADAIAFALPPASR